MASLSGDPNQCVFVDWTPLVQTFRLDEATIPEGVDHDEWIQAAETTEETFSSVTFRGFHGGPSLVLQITQKNAPKTHMFDTNKKTLTALWGGKSKYFWPISSGNQTWFAGKDPFSSMFCTFEAPLIGDFPGASWAGSCSCPCQVPLTCGGWGYMKHYEATTGEHGTMMTPDNSDRIYNDIHQFHHFFCTFHHISPHFTTFHHISPHFTW